MVGNVFIVVYDVPFGGVVIADAFFVVAAVAWMDGFVVDRHLEGMIHSIL